MKKFKKLRRWCRKNEALAIVLAATVIVTALYSLEYATGVSLSIRGSATYEQLGKKSVRNRRSFPRRTRKTRRAASAQSSTAPTR